MSAKKKSKPDDDTDPEQQPHVYRARQARRIIENAGRSKFVFWWECAHVPSMAISDYEMWHTNLIEDAQHIIFHACGITSIGELEDQWMPWTKLSKPQKIWDQLYGEYMKWLDAHT